MKEMEYVGARTWKIYWILNDKEVERIQFVFCAKNRTRNLIEEYGKKLKGDEINHHKDIFTRLIE